MRRQRRLLFSLPVVATIGVGACGTADGPAWIDLADGPGPTEMPGAETHRMHTTSGGREVRVWREGDGFWFVNEVIRADWKRMKGKDAWITTVPGRTLGRPADGPPGRLTAATGRVFHYADESWGGAEITGEPGSFFSLGDKLVLALEEGEAPPAVEMLERYAHPAHVDAEGRRRVNGKRFSGAGFAVPPGWRVRREVDVPPESLLTFQTVCEQALTSEAGTPRVTFRVLVHEEVVFEHEQEVVGEGSYAWHRISLPPAGAEGATIAFEVHGIPAFTSFLSASLGPAEVGTYGARPWRAARPDIVVFLADTFRADNLAVHGGRPDWTPELNRFADEGLTFTRAWAPSTNTLPSHASMFAGLYPLQTGADDIASPLPLELETIAERLHDWGYRTGAVTDALILSRNFGMDQGFASFDEYQSTLESTIARARDFLAADDGRPVFLFVQTYRAHTPYQVSDRTRREIAERTGRPFDSDFDELMARASLLTRETLDSAEGRTVLAALKEMYRAGVIDVDRGFGDFRRMLEAQGVVPGGWFVFTSDHGEAFGEHGAVWHSGPVYEEEVRVPLILHGPGLAPGRTARGASGVDFARTIADLARVPPAAHWEGDALLRLQEDRPIFACEGDFEMDGPPTVAIIDGRYKIIVLRDDDGLDWEDVCAAYDLEEDAGERTDLLGADLPWPQRILRRLGPISEGHLQACVDAPSLYLDAEQIATLEAMGYAARQR